jgi:hypothetical protein
MKGAQAEDEPARASIAFWLRSVLVRAAVQVHPYSSGMIRPLAVRERGGPMADRRRGGAPIKKRGQRDGRSIIGLVRLFAIAATGSALIRELRLPPAERTWHGVVAGFLPYDFRLPNVRRIQERMWAPEDERLVVPTVFGLGWTINLARLGALVGNRQVRKSR